MESMVSVAATMRRLAMVFGVLVLVRGLTPGHSGTGLFWKMVYPIDLARLQQCIVRESLGAWEG